jgi:hypothetical protein
MTNQSKISHSQKSRIAILQKENFRSFCLLLVVLFSTVGFSFGQLKVYPLPPPPSKQVIHKQKATNFRTQELIPRSLPFWDDFSTTITSITRDTLIENGDTLLTNYPLDTLWVESRNVSINNGLAIHPPSINVATLDGLKEDYLPYSSQPNFNGFRDELTSQPIKLNEVDAADRNSVFLSFFYQWSGNGEAPDANDYMRVEFKNDQSIWEPVMDIRTLLTSTTDKFYDTLVKVDGDRFFHEGFQFRFRNYGRQSGPYDTWNIDYVYLNKKRTATDRYLPDRTITSSLGKLFNDFRAIPYHHFLEKNKPVSNPQFDVFNVTNDISTLAYLTDAYYTAFKDSVALPTVSIEPLGPPPYGTTPIDGASGVIYSRERKTVTMVNIPEPSHFPDDVDSVHISLRVQLFTGDTFNRETGAFASDYDPTKFLPLDFRSNDTLRADYELGNYYAYDDGSGEYAVGLTAFGNRAAYQFEMLRDDPDTLIAIDIYFPDYGIPNPLAVDFTLYNDENGLPGSIIATIPSITVKQNGYNKFQRIRLGDPFLVEKKFYIGWKAPVGGVLRVGLDTNNDSGSKLFINTNGTWQQNTDVVGSVMIRPIFGGGTVIVGIEDEPLVGKVFPNPNAGEFFVPKSYNLIGVNTVTGQSIGFRSEQHSDLQKIFLNGAPPGLYILRLQQGSKLFSSKIMIR